MRLSCTVFEILSLIFQKLKRLHDSVTVTTPFQGQFAICWMELAMFNHRTKFEVSTITCNEDIKGNAQYKNSRFEPLFGDIGVTQWVHIWIYGKCVVDFLLVIIELFR